mmetsp:Transcript_33920/g.99965  ORF Transcript_33920/g.99965 Transcript_33920/m.99965 type:complete len:97 (-) Transcript_33920:533-823(-)
MKSKREKIKAMSIPVAAQCEAWQYPANKGHAKASEPRNPLEGANQRKSHANQTLCLQIHHLYQKHHRTYTKKTCMFHRRKKRIAGLPLPAVGLVLC